MTPEKLLEAIGEISPEAVRRAHEAVPARRQRRPVRRRFIAMAAAAALVLALSVTAWAVLDAGAWFKSWFADQTQSELTEGQQTYIDQAAAGIGQSVTADGWTVTLQSAVAEGYYCLLKLDVQAPEGVEMPRNLDLESRLASTDPAADEGLFAGGSYQWFPDSEPGREDVRTFLIEKSVPTEMQTGPVDYSKPLALTVENIHDNQETEQVLLAAGPWQFEFTVTPTQPEEHELISEPIECTATVSTSYYQGKPFDPSMLEPGQMIDSASGLEVVTEDVAITVTGLRMGTLGAVMAFTCDGETGESGPNVDPWKLEIRLAGGKTVDINGCAGSWDSDAGAGTLSIEFAEPVVWEEVTAVSYQGHPLDLD